MAVLFFASLSTVLFELALTRVFSIILWYDYAFMAISVAFFGLGIGSLMIHMHRDGEQKGRRLPLLLRRLLFPSTMSAESVTKKLVHHSIAYAVTVPLFIFAITQIPPDTSYIFMFYLVSSVPFFFAGSIMALVFFAMPRQISRLYFADLVGASFAALALDPLMQMFGAESVLLLTSILVAGSATAGAFALRSMEGRMKAPSIALLAGLVILLVATTPAIAIVQGAAMLQVTPGPNKGLYWQLKNPDFDHLSAKWNSFSRIDVTRQTDFTKTSDASQIRSSHELANIIIDADAGTPIYRWSGDREDLAWMRQYADYLPYDIVKAENSLVIGSGGGQDVMTAFAGGAKKVTAVELNPLVVSAVRTFGGPGNVYDNPDVELHIDDGRRFISSSADKFDTITIKLVDSWAAQLAGGYALSENYLYTVEAFQQYFRHLDSDGMLVMIRWNFEIPRLMLIVAEAVQRETGESREGIARHIVVMEDRPGLYFGRTDDSQDYYPVLVMVKAAPFTGEQVSLIKERAAEGRADVTMLADSRITPPYDLLFSSTDRSSYDDYVASTMGINTKMPTDDSPFYFSREPVPRQMVTLLGTVLAISAGLAAMLVVHQKKRKRTVRSSLPSSLPSSSSSQAGGYLVSFAVFIGLGFMILEITFIQKFLLLLGTPIMALTVILFSILLSSGIGAYLSGRLFKGRPHRAVFISVPVLAGMILFYLFSLQGIIDASITMDLPARAAITFALLSPAGLLMGFQFPSLIGMSANGSNDNSSNGSSGNDTTLLWGINIIASIIGTVLAALLAMVIGFSGNLVIGLAMYLGAGASAWLALAARGRYQPVRLPESE